MPVAFGHCDVMCTPNVTPPVSALRASSSVAIDGGSFIVVASGHADGPAQPLVRFLNDHRAARVSVLTHPLVPEGPGEHWFDQFIDGVAQGRRIRTLPNKPPFTYGFDPFVPFHIPRADAWIGFNCLATAQGLLRRRARLVRHVVHWNVDFVPQRFGASAMTAAYEWLDRRCCMRSDGRVELSEAAMGGRLDAYGLTRDDCPAEIIPMGAWNAESPKTSGANLANPRIVFLGHLVERMGLALLVETLAVLKSRGVDFRADIIGGGPLLSDVRLRCSDAGLGDVVTIHGFVADFADVARVLSEAVVAVAPYEVDEHSFSRFADPGKLKAYLGAGLPIVLTDVPPNADELSRLGGAVIVRPQPGAFADEIQTMLLDHALWQRRHQAALEYANRFDWDMLLSRSLPAVGIKLSDAR